MGICVSIARRSPPPQESDSCKFKLETAAQQQAPSYSQPRDIVTAARPACDAERRRRCSGGESWAGEGRPAARQLMPRAPGAD